LINTLENLICNVLLEMYNGAAKIVGCETFWAIYTQKDVLALGLPYDHFLSYPDLKATIEGLSKANDKEMLLTAK
jgi:hypothetical protein